MSKRTFGLIVIVCGLFMSVFAHAQTVQLPPWVHQQFLSSAGVPLSAACIYTYAAGTTTPLATYTDSTASTPNANPTQADSGGYVNLWLSSGVAYKFIVWSNPAGGACPGTPGGQMALQWTVDGITTSASSGGGAASQLTSSGANPATSGIARLTKSDTICWRNPGNSANYCMSLDPNGIVTWSQSSLALTEGGLPGGVTGEDLLLADSTAHRLKMNNNGGASVQIVASGADINTSDQVTATHLASALPTAQGGTGSTSASTGSGGVVLATSPALVTPTIGGATISAVPYMVWSSFANAANGLSLNVDLNNFVPQSAITVDEFSIVFYNSFWASCSPFPTFALYDVTASANVTTDTVAGSGTPFTASGPGLAANVAAAHKLGIRETSAGAGCSGNPTSIQFNVQYRMQ